MGSADDLKQDKQEEELRSGISSFKRGSLKHTEVKEKVVLPDNEAINQEKKETELRSSIEGFSKDGLKKADTSEKNTLPTKEVIEQEKAAN